MSSTVRIPVLPSAEVDFLRSARGPRKAAETRRGATGRVPCQPKLLNPNALTLQHCSPSDNQLRAQGRPRRQQVVGGPSICQDAQRCIAAEAKAPRSQASQESSASALYVDLLHARGRMRREPCVGRPRQRNHFGRCAGKKAAFSHEMTVFTGTIAAPKRAGTAAHKTPTRSQAFTGAQSAFTN